MTQHRTVLLAMTLVVASVTPAFGAASIQITDPQDQEFVNPGGGAPDPVTVTYQVTGNTCTGFRSSYSIVPYVNGVPVLCSGSGCGCDVIYREGPKVTDGADVTFIWDDPTPDIDGNGDEIIIAFGNPDRCPDRCSDKAQIMQINSEADPYKDWEITGDWKPSWWHGPGRKSNAEYSRLWHAWKKENPSWTKPADIDRGAKAIQCYTLVNYLTGWGDRVGFDITAPFNSFRPRDLSWWSRKVKRRGER